MLAFELHVLCPTLELVHGFVFPCSCVCESPVGVLLCSLVSLLDKIYGVLSTRSLVRLVAPVRGEPSLSKPPPA